MTVASDARRWRAAPMHKREQILTERMQPPPPPQIELSALIRSGEPVDHEAVAASVRSAKAMLQIEQALAEERAAAEQAQRNAWRASAVGQLLRSRQ